MFVAAVGKKPCMIKNDKTLRRVKEIDAFGLGNFKSASILFH